MHGTTNPFCITSMHEIISYCLRSDDFKFFKKYVWNSVTFNYALKILILPIFHIKSLLSSVWHKNHLKATLNQMILFLKIILWLGHLHFTLPTVLLKWSFKAIKRNFGAFTL